MAESNITRQARLDAKYLDVIRAGFGQFDGRTKSLIAEMVGWVVVTSKPQRPRLIFAFICSLMSGHYSVTDIQAAIKGGPGSTAKLLRAVTNHTAKWSKTLRRFVDN